MPLIGATDVEHAFLSEHASLSEHALLSEHAGIDRDVISPLLGTMPIVAVVRRTGVFAYIAVRAARRARGGPYRVCRRLGVPVVPFLVTAVTITTAAAYVWPRYFVLV
ncbi:hypothetical protein GCM10010261_48850 [Streptomyces pilosus]|uniref:hypothetical protein n=1 Tax=Streptomyces pilosus TaxID=28893 RepID=UPI0016795F62|nr:hypothetical protein [Streptomyces pilosus]GGV60639.1 hypothetical protein GCM10010261_48850 [Streptomyces pilosus]